MEQKAASPAAACLQKWRHEGESVHTHRNDVSWEFLGPKGVVRGPLGEIRSPTHLHTRLTHADTFVLNKHSHAKNVDILSDFYLE